jgi:hypothetical protein
MVDCSLMKEGTGKEPMTRKGPEVVAPTNRVNVALPFAKITVQEPSQEFGELATIVAELCAVVGKLAPDPALRQLRDRALALASRGG